MSDSSSEYSKQETFKKVNRNGFMNGHRPTERTDGKVSYEVFWKSLLRIETREKIFTYGKWSTGNGIKIEVINQIVVKR